MTSVFKKQKRVGDCGPADCCDGGSMEPSFHLSPSSKSKISPSFEVGSGINDAVVIRAFGLQGNNTVGVEIVSGFCGNEVIEVFYQHGAAVQLERTHNMLVLQIPGRYRLVASNEPGPDMPTVEVVDIRR